MRRIDVPGLLLAAAFCAALQGCGCSGGNDGAAETPAAEIEVPAHVQDKEAYRRTHDKAYLERLDAHAADRRLAMKRMAAAQDELKAAIAAGADASALATFSNAVERAAQGLRDAEAEAEATVRAAIRKEVASVENGVERKTEETK